MLEFERKYYVIRYHSGLISKSPYILIKKEMRCKIIYLVFPIIFNPNPNFDYMHQT